MARSIDEWKEVTKKREGESNLQLILEHQRVPESYYKDLTKKNRKEQGQLAVALCQLAGVSLDQAASLSDLEAFEEVLGCV